MFWSVHLGNDEADLDNICFLFPVFVDSVASVYVLSTSVSSVSISVTLFKPLTDEQVFYDTFYYDKFTLPSVGVYAQQFFYDKFVFDKFKRCWILT